jgi:hypothetical protein
MESIEWFFVLVCETQGRLTQPLSRIFCQHDNNKDQPNDDVLSTSLALTKRSVTHAYLKRQAALMCCIPPEENSGVKRS